MQKIEQEKFQHQIKILFLGEIGTGKTTLLLKYVTQEYCPQQSTVGVDYKQKFVEYQGKMIKLQLWDSAGLEKFQSISQNYFRKANSIFFIYEITNKKPFEEVFRLLNDVEQLASPDVIKVLIGSKIDLNYKREVSYDKGKQFALQNDLEFFELSSFWNRNLEDPINYVLEQFLKQKESKQKQNIQKKQNNVALSNQIVPMSNIKTQYFDHKLNIYLAGNTATGKSSLIQKYCFQKIISTRPNLGCDVNYKIVEYQGKKIKIVLWEIYMPKVQNFYIKANSVFLIYDISQNFTFQEIFNLINLVERSAPRDAINVLIGNKIDLNCRRQVSSGEGQQMAQDRKFQFYETSAFYDNPLEDPINYVLEQFLKQKESEQQQNIEMNQLNLSFSNQIVNLSQSNSMIQVENKKGCC
ncbi:unnamed protein product [Paramecium octaurelia]|uniref:Uncharacterized protein n=1 Tax=Paramecium octaurelia TaxID=43137 RepID=A0A8S1Y341_PAROT|nr:unnamed protein product [Paramecium octaurelia]